MRQNKGFHLYAKYGVQTFPHHIWRVWCIFHDGHVSGAKREHFYVIKTHCMYDSKPNSWLITIMKGPSGVLLRYVVQYKKSITSAHWCRNVWACSESPLWPNSVAWEKILGFFTEGMSNCHIHPPLFLSFSPLSPLPPPHSPTQDTSVIQAKGPTLKQSLPLILAWLLRPPISRQCAWYLSTGSSPLIKTATDRRMWISGAIMCLLKIISVFSQLWEQKGIVEIQPRSKVMFLFSPLFFCRCGIGCGNILGEFDTLLPDLFTLPPHCNIQYTVRF